MSQRTQLFITDHKTKTEKNTSEQKRNEKKFTKKKSSIFHSNNNEKLKQNNLYSQFICCVKATMF